MAAKPNKTQHKEALSIEQLNAIDLLVLGKTDKEVAEAVGVHRCTVTGWRLYNPYFQAELNRRRKEVWGAVDRFRSLLQKALDAVEKALEDGDAKTALEVLRMSGLDIGKGTSLGSYMVGEDDPDAIIEQHVSKAKGREIYRVTPPPTDWEKRNALAELERLAKELERLQAGT